jgi:hypothetical protein
MSAARPPFPVNLPAELENDRHRLNPWWRGLPPAPLPRVKRWAFALTLRRLRSGPAKALVLRGPRQVGKSTLVLQIIQTLLEEGASPTHLFYLQFDELATLSKLTEPILRLADWFEGHVLGKTVNQVAAEGGQIFFFDEAQNVDAWAPQLKFLVDTSAVRVILTGSSALRI